MVAASHGTTGSVNPLQTPVVVDVLVLLVEEVVVDDVIVDDVTVLDVVVAVVVMQTPHKTGHRLRWASKGQNFDVDGSHSTRSSAIPLHRRTEVVLELVVVEDGVVTVDVVVVELLLVVEDGVVLDDTVDDVLRVLVVVVDKVVVVATTSDVATTDSADIVPLDVVSVAAPEFKSIAL